MRSRILAAALTVAFGLLSIGPALAAGGQFGNLTGTVIDAATKAPIAGAAVSAKSGSGSYSSRTDGAGHFTILGMNVDSYTVTITANGHETVNIPNVVVFGDETGSVGVVQMAKQLTEIAHVTSRSQSSAYQPTQTIDSYTVNQQQILQTTGKSDTTNENNVLLSVPGVTMTNAGNVTIRGGAEFEVGYQYDGVTFKDPFLGMNGSNGLINGLGSVQVVEGAGDATQGGVGAGVINVIPQRGSGPGTGEVDLEAGGPNFSHQFAFNYGFSTPNNRFSEYISYNGQRFAPYFGYATTPLNQYGNFFGTTYQSNNQFTNNFFFNFGRNNSQTIQFLYTNISQIGLQGNGGIGLEYYPYDTTTQFAFGGALGVSSGYLTNLTPDQYAGLIGLTPGTPATNTGVPGNQQNFSNNTNFLKLEYDNRLNPTTYFDFRYYNWSALSNSDTTYSLGAPQAGIFGFGAFQQTIGGYTSGISTDLEKQFGANLTVSLEGQYNWLHPLFDLYDPTDETIVPYATGLNNPLMATDWATGGYFCGYAQFNCGANPLGIADARLPTWGINYQKTLFQNWGAGLRAQYSATDNLKFDLGVREEGQNQLWNSSPYAQTPSVGYAYSCAGPIAAGMPGATPAQLAAALKAGCTGANAGTINNPYDVISSSWTNNVLHPTELQPRLAVSWEASRWDAFRFGYGRSAVFQNAQNGGTPFNVYSNLARYQGIAPQNAAGGALCGWTATLVFPCINAAQQIYWQGDNLEAPDAGNGRPALYNNYDLSWNHLFKNGWGTRLTPFIKIGQSLPAGFYLNPVLGIFAVGNQGYNKTTGVEANVTTPQTHFGLSGFFTATYQNVLSTTPPFTLDETEVPTVPNASLNLGNLYRAGYVSPFDIRVGALENLKNGITISPQLEYNIGYPYTVGNLIAACVNPALACTSASTGLANIPQVDFGPGIIGGLTSLIGSAPGAAVSTNYYDPADPGNAFHPNIAATRGTPGTSANGGYLSHANLTADLTVQWKHGPNTVGIQMLNLFGNAFINSVPAINPWYQPVANGLSGPQTGYNSCGGQVGANVRGCYPYTPKDIYAFNNGAYLLTNGNFSTVTPTYAPLQPFTFQVYYQRAL
jgi:hypothetical protein